MQRGPGRSSTLTGIAAEAGVSVSTVSKVLNGRTDVAPRTRERIGQLLRGYGYQVAPGMRFGVVDLLIGTLHGPWAEELIRGAVDAAREGGHSIVVTTVSASAEFAAWLDHAARPLLINDQSWQAGVIEGPSMIEEGSLFYLFYSGNPWDTANYSVGYAVCSTPQGPCAEPIDRSLYGSKGQTAGPGGARRFTTFDGQLLMSYAAWSRGRVAEDGGARSMRLDPVSFANGVPQIRGPDVGPVNVPS